MTDKCPILGIKFELNKQGQDWGKGKKTIGKLLHL